MQMLDKFARRSRQARRPAALTGAGVGAESGVPGEILPQIVRRLQTPRN